MKRVVLLFVVVGAVFLSGIAWAGESPEGWRIERGPDGFEVAVPPGGTAASGTDGRLVAVPAEWTVERGPDGRAVAVPPEGTIERGPDNRLVAIPKGWTAEVGSDGRAVAVPPGGRTERGPDGRLVVIPKGWTTEAGPDGRAVPVPPGGTTVQRPDGRLVAVPEGWSVKKGSDGLAVAVPSGGEIVEGPEGRERLIITPRLDWDDPVTQILILDAQAQPKMWQVVFRERVAQVDVRIEERVEINEHGDPVVKRIGHIDITVEEWEEYSDPMEDWAYQVAQGESAALESGYQALGTVSSSSVGLEDGQDESYLWELADEALPEGRHARVILHATEVN